MEKGSDSSSPMICVKSVPVVVPAPTRPLRGQTSLPSKFESPAQRTPILYFATPPKTPAVPKFIHASFLYKSGL